MPRPGSGFSATGAAASSSRYTFGAANKPFELELGLAGAEQGLDERALLEMAKGDLADALRDKTGGGSSGGGTGGGAVYSDRAAPLGFVGAEAKKALDSSAWSLVRRWVGTHKMLNSKRLVCVVLVNEPPCSVQVGEPHLRVGQACQLPADYAHVGGCFDRAHRTLRPGGAALLVAWSFGLNPFKKQHVMVSLETSACVVVAPDMRSKMGARAMEGFSSGLLESSGSENKERAKAMASLAAR